MATKNFTTTDEEAVNSKAVRVYVTLPPWSWTGELEIGVMHHWSPPFSILLTTGYVEATTVGTGQAGFAFMKKVQPDVGLDQLLGTVNLRSIDYKKTFEFDNSKAPKIVTPYDKLYVVSFAESGHTHGTVQLLGERIN